MSELRHVARGEHLETGARDEVSHGLCGIDGADRIVITPDQQSRHAQAFQLGRSKAHGAAEPEGLDEHTQLGQVGRDGDSVVAASDQGVDQLGVAHDGFSLAD